MRWATLSLVVLCAVPLAARAAGGGSIKAALEAENKKFMAAATAKDADAIGKLYAPDAEALPPGHPLVKGREEIARFWKAELEQFTLVSLSTDEVHPMGSYTVEVGAWTGKGADGKTVQGKYMVVWKKAGSGWQLYRDMWSDNGSSEAPKPAPAATTPMPGK